MGTLPPARRSRGLHSSALARLACAFWILANTAWADSVESTQIEVPTTVRVAASDRYGTSRTNVMVLGGGYRELWKAEIELPVLDLQKRELVPIGRFGIQVLHGHPAERFPGPVNPLRASARPASDGKDHVIAKNAVQEKKTAFHHFPVSR